MFKLQAPIPVVTVENYKRSEVHLLAGETPHPRAVVSFVAVDSQGATVPGAPVAVVTLSGTAYNRFFTDWRTEADLYRLALALALENASGCEVSGVDLAKVAGMITATEAEEVVAVV